MNWPRGKLSGSSDVRSELFDYPLPPERIAQTPLEPRDAARLLLVPPRGPLEHRAVRDLPDLLQRGDLLVFNDTRVLPARLAGRKLGPDGRTEGARVEALLLRRLEEDGTRWAALLHPARRLRPGTRIVFGDGELAAEVGGAAGEGARLLALSAASGPVQETLARLGRVPLPPYIHTELADPERYQTVYAREEGSAAAPTAGLHFTPALLDCLESRGVLRAAVTLHVGLATFQPIRTERIAEHVMHAEWYRVPESTRTAIAACHARGGRVVAVGTTTVRALESWAAHPHEADTGFRPTRLYITPGYPFHVVDLLLTNFHQPRSSLLVLVSAFSGLARIREAYAAALREGYRFLSFGDAMLLQRSRDGSDAGEPEEARGHTAGKLPPGAGTAGTH